METNPPKFDTLSMLQLIMGGLGLVLAAAGTLLVLLVGSVRIPGMAPVGLTRSFSMTAVGLLYSLILLPSVILPIYRLQGKPLPRLAVGNSFKLATFLMFLWPFLVALGWFVSRQPELGWALLPVLSILTIGIPVFWLVEVGRRRLPGGSLQRSWGLLGYGVVPNVLLIIITELLVIVLLVVLYGIYVSGHPDLTAQLEALVQRIRSMGNDPQQLMQLAQTFLSQPGAVFAVLAVGSVLMPMIEEMLKPLGMWFIAGRIRTPAEGFNAGLVCGGAFAFVESLNLATGMTDSGWTTVVFARVGAGLLHVVTSGLVGWGLASAWTQGRYLRQALTFLAAVALHGLWNFFGLLMGFWSIFPGGMSAPAVEGVTLRTLIGPVVLIVLAAAMLFVLLWLGGRLRGEVRAGQVEIQPVNLAPVSSTSGNLLVESNSATRAESAVEGESNLPDEAAPREGDNEQG